MWNEPGPRRRAPRIAGAGCLAAAAAAVRFSPLYGPFLGQVMLFTQKSPQTLAGALRAASQFAPLYAVLLAVFRAVLLPWLPPLLPIADTMVFGTAPGILIAWAGNVAGASVCFALSRLLLGGTVSGRLPPAARAFLTRWGGVGCGAALLLLPWAGGLAGYLLGLSPLPCRRWLLGIAWGELLCVLAYGLCCSPYTTVLPGRVLLWGRALAVCMVLGAFVWHWYRDVRRHP